MIHVKMNKSLSKGVFKHHSSLEQHGLQERLQKHTVLLLLVEYMAHINYFMLDILWYLNEYYYAFLFIF